MFVISYHDKTKKTLWKYAQHASLISRGNFIHFIHNAPSIRSTFICLILSKPLQLWAVATERMTMVEKAVTRSLLIPQGMVRSTLV